MSLALIPDELAQTDLRRYLLTVSDLPDDDHSGHELSLAELAERQSADRVR